MKTVVKKYKAAIAAGDKELANATYLDAVKKVDQAVAKGIIHKNNANRKKSQFTLMLNNLG
jgi:small subunit ribosomal protein S20